MTSATATAPVQYVARCCHPSCANLVSVAPHCPAHGGWRHLNAVLASAPVYEASATWAALRGEFRQVRSAA